VIGCLRRVVVLVVILLLLGGAYLFRGRIAQEWHRLRGTQPAAQVPSAELAEDVNRRIEALRNNEVDRIALGSNELQSLIEYKYMGMLPAFARSPHVELDGDRIKLQIRVPSNQLPNLSGLEAASFLPDTTDLELSGSIIPLDSGRVAFGVDQVQTAGIPLPQRMINEALRRVGRKDEPLLPKDAIAVGLPRGVRSAYIRNDSLILLARPR
jgi:hypothetical protein